MIKMKNILLWIGKRACLALTIIFVFEIAFKITGREIEAVILALTLPVSIDVLRDHLAKERVES